jgi:hypothetical protein
MPNYIRIKQLDQPELSGFVADTIGTSDFVANTAKDLVSGFVVSYNDPAGNFALRSGDQTISGVKTFSTGIFAPNLVYKTGNQNIDGTKTFSSLPTVNGSGLALNQDIDLKAIAYSIALG